METKNGYVSELNPDGLADIDAVLRKSDDEQLWFFLDDCIPGKKDISVLFLTTPAKIGEDGAIENVKEATTAITDRLFFGDTSDEALEASGLAYMKPYLPLLGHCYRPYEWSMSLSCPTDGDIVTLQSLVEKNDCRVTARDLSDAAAKGIPVLRVAVGILFGSIDQTAEGWLYSAGDFEPEEG